MISLFTQNNTDNTVLKKLDCWLRGVKFLLITDHKSLTFLINKRMDEMKPTIARKVIFLQQYYFDIIHKDGDKIKHADVYRGIYLTQISRQISNKDRYIVDNELIYH